MLEKLKMLAAMQEVHETSKVRKLSPPCCLCEIQGIVAPSTNGSDILTGVDDDKKKATIAKFNAMKAIGPVCRSCFLDPTSVERAMSAIVTQVTSEPATKVAKR